MNSYDILKRLRKFAACFSEGTPNREVLDQTIRHIEGQDDEILELREDITDVSIPEIPE